MIHFIFSLWFAGFLTVSLAVSLIGYITFESEKAKRVIKEADSRMSHFVNSTKDFWDAFYLGLSLVFFLIGFVSMELGIYLDMDDVSPRSAWYFVPVIVASFVTIVGLLIRDTLVTRAIAKLKSALDATLQTNAGEMNCGA